MNVPKARKLSSGNWFIQLRLGGESVSITAATEKACTHQAELAKAQYLNDARVSPLKGGNMTLRAALNAYIDS